MNFQKKDLETNCTAEVCNLSNKGKFSSKQQIQIIALQQYLIDGKEETFIQKNQFQIVEGDIEGWGDFEFSWNLRKSTWDLVMLASSGTVRTWRLHFHSNIYLK